MFDDLEPEELVVFRAEARRLAATLGADVQGVEDKSLGACWRFADPACEKFAEEVPGEMLATADRFKMGGASGIVQVDRENDLWEFCQRVEEGDLVEWKDSKRGGGCRDERLGPTVRNTDGVRQTTLRDAWPELKAEKQADRPFEGPNWTCEFFPAVLATGHELLTYGPHYIRSSGLNPTSGLAIQFGVLLMILHFAVTIDQLNPRNLHCLELCVRRLLMIQKAVKRNAKAPDFDGLEIYLSHRYDSSGGVVSSNFDKHIAEMQKSEATIMKQMRLWHEEIDSKHKNQNRKTNGNKDENSKGGQKGQDNKWWLPRWLPAVVVTQLPNRILLPPNLNHACWIARCLRAVYRMLPVLAVFLPWIPARVLGPVVSQALMLQVSKAASLVLSELCVELVVVRLCYGRVVNHES